MEIILNAGLGIGALMLFLLLFKKDKEGTDYLLLLWILVMIMQITFYEITIYHFDLHGIGAIAAFGLPLLGASVLFLYIFALTGHKITITTVVAHLSIYFLYIFLFFVLKEVGNIDLTASDGYFELPSNAPLWLQHYPSPLAVSGLVYCIWDLVLLKQHRKKISSFFSFDEKINLRWIQYLVYSYFILFVVASFLIFGAIHFSIMPIEKAFSLVGIALSLLLVTYGFYGFRQTGIFTNIELENGHVPVWQVPISETAAYSKSGLATDKIKVLAEELARHMEQEKPFLNEDLSLPILADQCNISQAHLSQVINQHFRKNFYDFVNQYRVEEAKKRLGSSDFDHLSVLGIAFDCGFKSKSSFNRYFKKYAGVSPSDFKKNS